eukprot:m.58573 g.58573  ORF g.58573 m.58573 type:complete len:209 (-) comp49168_c0_seq10:205-831(-)
MALLEGSPYTLTSNAALEGRIRNQLLTTWEKLEFKVSGVTEVLQVHNPILEARYKKYCARLRASGVDPGEQELFHGTKNRCDGRGCKGERCGVCGILSHGFLRDCVRSKVFQRYGLGFYFASNSSKSHEYPLSSLPSSEGEHARAQLVCKVALGKQHRTKTDMRSLTQPPAGCHSVHGVVGGSDAFSLACFLPFPSQKNHLIEARSCA